MTIDDAKLDALIQRARLDSGFDALQVDMTAVHAYLTGVATAAQKSTVRKALAESAEFRRELLALATHLEATAAEAPAPAPAPDARTAWEKPRASILERLREALEAFLPSPSWRMLVVPIAAACLVAVVVVPLTRRSESPILAITQTAFVDLREILQAPGSPRGEFDSHTDAVLARLRECIQEDPSGVRLVPQETSAETPFAALLTARIVDEKGSEIRTFRFLGPADHAPENIKAWLVNLRPDTGSVELRSHDVHRRHFTIGWTRGKEAVLIVTAETASGYVASPCLPVVAP